MIIIYLGVGWLVGLWLASTTELNTTAWVLVGISGLSGWRIFRQHRIVGMGWLCLFAIGMGGARYTTAVPLIDQNHVAFYNGNRDVTLTGLVVDEPDVRDRSVNLRLGVDSIALANGQFRLVEGIVLVRSPRFPLIKYGTRLEVTGRLETPQEFESFNYKDFLARQGIQSKIDFPQLKIMAEREGNPVKQAIFALKDKAYVVINRLIPEPQSALLSGILLGNDKGISPDLQEDFRSTGLTHIIAISGFNIAILIAVLMRISEPFLPRWGVVIFAVVGVLFYTLLVGADASVVRAAIMGTIYLFTSRLLGRQAYAYASLILAGFLMTLLDPFVLWDVGFQLSFAATLSLMIYAEPFTQWTRERLLKRWEEKAVKQVMNLITDSVIITIAAQILTMPLMIAHFGQMSLISLIANAFVLPAQPGVMIWGGLATLAGIVVPAVGQFFGYVSWLFLGYTTGLVRVFANIPGASIPVNISVISVIFIYFVLTLITWVVKQGPDKRAMLWEKIRPNLTRRLAFSSSLMFGLLVTSWAMTQPDGRLHVVFFDVGQGDAIFIQSPSGRQILVDGGLYPTVLNDELGRQMPFWDKELDIMVATHADADHVSGLPGVFDRFRVVQLITNGQEEGESAVYDEVLQAAGTAGTEINSAFVGEKIVIDDGVWLEVLHPGEELFPDDRNENSVCLRLLYGDFTLLLTGDAEERAERLMVERGLKLDALVFKAGHHGSRSSSNDFFLEAVRPQIIIISAGADNRFSHPHPEVLERARAVGAAVLRTDELGTIELISDGERMWWEANGK